MVKRHRGQIKKERNVVKDTRPSAKLSYVRIFIQKVRFVLDATRGRDVQAAPDIVTCNSRCASTLIKKLLESAIASVGDNNNISVENPYVEGCYASKRPTMKKVRPRIQGRAYRIERRMNRVIVVLNER